MALWLGSTQFLHFPHIPTGNTRLGLEKSAPGRQTHGGQGQPQPEENKVGAATVECLACHSVCAQPAGGMERLAQDEGEGQQPSNAVGGATDTSVESDTGPGAEAGARANKASAAECRQRRKMPIDPVSQIRVCYDHVHAEGGCVRWGCRYAHVACGLEGGKGRGGGRDEEEKEEAAGDETEEEGDGQRPGYVQSVIGRGSLCVIANGTPLLFIPTSLSTFAERHVIIKCSVSHSVSFLPRLQAQCCHDSGRWWRD